MKTNNITYYFILALVLMITFPFSVVAQETVRKKVAVYMTGSDVDNSIKKVIGSKIVSAVTNTSGFAAVERTSDFLEALSKEQDYQTSGEVRDSQIAKLGQRFGVRFVIVADINEVFEEYFIDARLINVETGLVERTADITGEMNSAQQVIKMAQALAADLLKGVNGSAGRNETRVNGRVAVDLGLSVKWADCNIGASSPEQYGDYYAWGEINTKSNYNAGTSITYGRVMGSISGSSDFDAARAIWGGKWRLPTRVEMQELVDLCQWEWLSQGGNTGYKVTGPNGNSIFLPAAGTRDGSFGGQFWMNARGTIANYWTGTPDDKYTYILYFSKEGNRWVNSVDRARGISVRPVTD